MGCYAGNWKLYKEGAGQLEKVGGGVYKVCLPMYEYRALPFLEPNADTGKNAVLGKFDDADIAAGPYVRALLDLPPGTNLVCAGLPILWGEWSNTWVE